jgi:hypothetical protein
VLHPPTLEVLGARLNLRLVLVELVADHPLLRVLFRFLEIFLIVKVTELHEGGENLAATNASSISAEAVQESNKAVHEYNSIAESSEVLKNNDSGKIMEDAARYENESDAGRPSQPYQMVRLGSKLGRRFSSQ